MSNVSPGALLGDFHFDQQRLIHHAVGIDDRMALVGSVRDGGDPGAHLLRGARAQFGDRAIHGVRPIAVEQGGEAFLADGERRRLRLDVADALVGDADVGQDDGEDFLVHHAALEQLHRRQAQSFLLRFGGMRREAARHHAADVRPVAGIGEPREQLALVEKRFDEAHVHQMRAAEIRVVDDEHVAGLDAFRALYHRLGGELHGADEHRQAQFALRDQRAVVAVVNAVGTVHGLGDHRRKRRATERQVHFVADLVEAVLDHGQGDGVELHIASFHTVTSRLPSASSSTRLPGSITVVQSSCSMMAGPVNLASCGSLSRW